VEATKIAKEMFPAYFKAVEPMTVGEQKMLVANKLIQILPYMESQYANLLNTPLGHLEGLLANYTSESPFGTAA
jgi:hypothetical protein